MAYNDAHRFLTAEISSGSGLPVEYDIPATQGGHFKVIALPPQRAKRLEEIRKEAGIGGINEISFAPTGGCPMCGR